MHQTHRLLVVICIALMTAPLAGQPAEGALPAEASRRLNAILGTWDSTWHRLRPDGSVITSFSGTEEATWAIEGRVVLLSTEVPSQNSRSKAFMYYSEIDQRFHLVSVDGRGDMWQLSGDLDAYVITSTPRQRPNRGEFIIRFTHDEIDDDHFTAVMETSIDGGESWRTSVKQELARRGAADGGETP